MSALVPRRRNLQGTVYLVLDHSTSMGDPGKMEQLRRGALRFFLEAVQRDYAVGAVAFAGGAETITGASLNAHRFWKRLHGLRPYGRTAMASGLRLGLVRLAVPARRKVHDPDHRRRARRSRGDARSGSAGQGAGRDPDSDRNGRGRSCVPRHAGGTVRSWRVTSRPRTSRARSRALRAAWT
ncbi:MAG: VWA domain-containing protein, partial [Trueperaceae bacterium]|nr:VWA domain-containing protein [Trueperaceae bacterium]